MRKRYIKPTMECVFMEGITILSASKNSNNSVPKRKNIRGGNKQYDIRSQPDDIEIDYSSIETIDFPLDI